MGEFNDNKSLNPPIIFTSVVRIHLDGGFYPSAKQTPNLFTITSYLLLSKNPSIQEKSEE